MPVAFHAPMRPPYIPGRGAVVVVVELRPGSRGNLPVGSIVAFNCSGDCGAHHEDDYGNATKPNQASWFGLTARSDELFASCHCRPATEAEEAIWRMLGDGASFTQEEDHAEG